MNRFIVILLFTSSALASCADSTTPDPVGGETHFLRSCDTDEACGLGLECVCGVCTKPCSTDNTCKNESTLATCKPAGTPSGACINPQASPVCDVECTGATDCASLGNGYTCESGSCRKLSTNACVHEGVIYPRDATFMIDCNACTCTDGEIGCTQIGCIDAGPDARFDGGTDGGDDSSVAENVIPERACGVGDVDAGTGELIPIPPLTPMCSAVDSTLALPGAAVVGSSPNVYTLALTDDQVVWSSFDEPFLARATKTGGDASGATFALGQHPAYPDTIQALFADGCRAFWGNAPTGSIVEIGSWDLDGSDFRVLARVDALNVDGMHVDPSHVYFFASGSLLRVPRGGGSLVAMAGVTRDIAALAGNTTTLYWLELDGSLETALDVLMAMPKDRSTAAEVIRSDLPNPGSMVVDEAATFIGSMGTLDSFGNPQGGGGVFRVEHGTGAITTLTQTVPGALVQDTTHLYWIARNGRSIARIAKSGGNVTTLFEGLDGCRHLAVDSTHLYWTVGCSGQGSHVVRVPKP